MTNKEAAELKIGGEVLCYVYSVSYTHLVIGAGDIGAGVGFKDIRTGDTLCDEDAPIVLESMEFPLSLIHI